MLYAIEFPHTHTHTHTHTHRLQYQQLLHTPTYITEESASETTDSISADITVQPHSFKVVIVSNRYVMDVPYTANVTPEYADGTKGSSYTFSGVYEGVQVNEICVIFGADVPLIPKSIQNLGCIIINFNFVRIAYCLFSLQKNNHVGYISPLLPRAHAQGVM